MTASLRPRRHPSIAFFLVLLLLAAVPPARAAWTLQEAFPHLVFEGPVDLQTPPSGGDLLFVVEQAGRIRAFQNNPETSTAPVVLDLTAKVTSGGEMGLLGLAFAPDFQTSGHLYVDYTTEVDGPRRTVVERYTVVDPITGGVDPASGVEILSVEQPYPNHNGGQIAFGPDGHLHVALGDGGDAGDPLGNGQDRGTLLGSILRLDVGGGGGGYAIPADNPFVGNGQGWREEIWAWGLRNPWRFSFDTSGGATTLWCGDVGQNEWEEVDRIQKGGNHGWNTLEGESCYDPPSGCDPAGTVLPVHVYGHVDGNRSITGGYVYRGTRLPSLEGRYVFGDFGSGRIWALDPQSGDPPSVELLVDGPDGGLTSFGTDARGELYAVFADGRLRILQPGATDAPAPARARVELLPGAPNPFNPRTTLRYRLAEAGRVRLEIYDARGRAVRRLLDGVRGAGEHRATWDGTDDGGRPLPSGVYRARLRTGRGADTRPLVLAR